MPVHWGLTDIHVNMKILDGQEFCVTFGILKSQGHNRMDLKGKAAYLLVK